MSLLKFTNLRGDFFGGLTAGIVALPLALAFGEASGAGPIAGVYGAMIVGFFAALLGGTQTQISGPTGPMIVVFAGVFSSFSGDPKLVFTTVIIAGLLQIVFGVLRLGQYIRLVPYPVVSGFMSGIGAIIIFLQISRLFGHEPIEKGTISAISSIVPAVGDPVIPALFVGIVALLVVFFWPKKIAKFLPAPLAALIIGTLLGLIFKGAPLLGNIPTGLPSFIAPALSQDTFMIMIKAALILALLGSIDSLLTSIVADNMTRTRHNSNRELIGQGVGNSIAGFFGGIPGAGATMRTVVNIRTGGTTNLSGIIHSLFLFTIVIILAPLAELIPHSVLAGILIKVGYDIIDWQYLKKAHKGPRWDLLLMILVLGLTVFVDLISAVIVGVILAALAFVKQLADAQLKRLDMTGQTGSEEEQEIIKKFSDRIMILGFGGPLSFGAAAEVAHRVRILSASKDTNILLLDFDNVHFMDLSAAYAVDNIVSEAKEDNKLVYMMGLDNKVKKTMKGILSEENYSYSIFFKNRIDAFNSVKKSLLK